MKNQKQDELANLNELRNNWQQLTLTQRWRILLRTALLLVKNALKLGQ